MLPFVRNGKTLLSGVDPVRRGDRTADAVSLKDKTLYFCPSPLYGYGLARLLTRLDSEAPGSAILCIEADPELYKLSIKSLPSSITSDKKFRLTNLCKAEELCAFVREAWGERAFRRAEVVRLSGGWQLFPELYDLLCEALRQNIATDWSNALTLTKLGRLYIRNAFRNLALIPHFPSIASLSYGEAPVLVLGAGPSLDETLDFLENNLPQMLRCPDNRPFKIVCVDTCLGALKDRGITPDLVVILESQHWNLHDFTGSRGWEVPFVMDLSALPASAKMLGKGFLFMTPWTHLRLFERLKAAELLPAIVPPLGSVGLTAVELARRLTRGKIICAGLDFSFTADKYHARSTPGHRNKLNAQSRFCSTINVSAYDESSFAAVSKSGAPVRSNPALRHYRGIFEQEFAADHRLFDIAGCGLPLGLKTLSLEMLSEVITRRHEGAKAQRGINKEQTEALAGRLAGFLKGEKERLIVLRAILTGEAAVEQERALTLIDECDYLWAHFPDYSRRPDLTDVSFLKRLRMEIDPMLGLMS